MLRPLRASNLERKRGGGETQPELSDSGGQGYIVSPPQHPPPTEQGKGIAESPPLF